MGSQKLKVDKTLIPTGADKIAATYNNTRRFTVLKG